MQNMLWITHLRIKWYNEKVGALNSKKTDGKFLMNARKHSRLVTQPVSNVTYMPHRLSTFGNFDEVSNTCKISTVKSLTALWIKRLTKPLEKNISSKGIFQKGKRVTSAVRYVHFPVLLRICLLTTTVEEPVNWKFFCRFWAISFSTLIYTLIHLNFYNTEEHLQLAQFLFCLLMFLRKTIIICQVQVNILLVQFLDMLLSIPVLVFFGVLSVYSSLVLNHTFTFLSILTGMLRKPSLRLLLAHFEKHENFNTLQ